MHFEILVEDQSGKTALDILIPKIIGVEHTFEVHSYKGVGRVPKNLDSKADPEKRILLDRIPKLLAGYGRTFANYPRSYRAAVIIVCDLDRRNLSAFSAELAAVINHIDNPPPHAFCVAIEEGEAWFLGDLCALRKAYPKAKQAVLSGYNQDSICGTWELLADAIYPGGSEALIPLGYQAIGREKNAWAAGISQHMVPVANVSPSFRRFCQALVNIANADALGT